jgi:hypothetical protein
MTIKTRFQIGIPFQPTLGDGVSIPASVSCWGTMTGLRKWGKKVIVRTAKPPKITTRPPLPLAVSHGMGYFMRKKVIIAMEKAQTTEKNIA